MSPIVAPVAECAPRAAVAPAGDCACPGNLPQECDVAGTLTCVEALATNEDHCGACGNECSTGECKGGVCNPIVDVAVGTENICVLRDNGDVYCLGSDAVGGLGDGGTSPNSKASFDQKVSLSAAATQVDGGDRMTVP